MGLVYDSTCMTDMFHLPYMSICPSQTSVMNPGRGIIAIPTRFRTVLVSTSKYVYSISQFRSL